MSTLGSLPGGARRHRERLREIRNLHASQPGLWERLTRAEPARAREAYLEAQLAMSERLSTTMARARDAGELMGAVVEELHTTFDLYLAEIQRLDDDRTLRIVAAAGPLSAEDRRFLISEQPLHTGVNGRVGRTGQAALITDTREDPDYIVRDPSSDPLSELAVPIFVDGQVWGVLNLEEVRPGAFDAADASLMRTVATQLGVALHRIAIYGDLEQALGTTLSVLSAAMEVRDPYTAQHEEAVAELAVATAAELGLGRHEQQAVRYAALTHDIGKISVPAAILGKPGSLDEAEWEVMRRHTITGAQMLAGIPFFDEVHPLVRGHHERFDGGGYPDGLAGEAIPVGARILCVCDSYNAMITSRPYRAAMPVGDALDELRRGSGTQFDPRIVAAFERALAV
jgi:putative nucleotidyltransferase with HDIG domain